MAKDVILEADLGGTPLSPEELAAVPDFSEIKPKIWEKFPGAIARKTFRAGELVFQEGDHGTTAFYIYSGQAEIFLGGTIHSAQSRKGPRRGLFGKITKLTNYVKGVPDRGPKAQSARTHIPLDGTIDVPIENPIAELGAGELFGELSALAALKQERVKRAKFYPRSASVRAKTDLTVFEMLPNILNNVLYNSKAFKDKLNDNYRRRALDTHLLSVPIFRDVGEEFLDYLRERVELVDVQPGEVICRQGEAADAFYLIRLGFVKVSQNFPGGELVLTYLSRGAYFGEMGLIPPALQIRAKGGQENQKGQAVLTSEPIICGRAPTQDRALTLDWDGYISREHFTAAIEKGKVRVTRLPSGKNPITYRMKPADTFLAAPGDTFVVGGTTFEIYEDRERTGYRTATCTAMDFVQLVKLRGEDFQQMLTMFPDVAQATTAIARERQQMNLDMLNRMRTVSLNDFLKQELMQGQNLLLLDLERCTRCDECAKACVATHDDGVSRLIREGLRFDKYLVPTSCRACMDPLCMTRCPVGSIRRKDTLDIVIEDWCIGCSNCAVDCPYGNINIVPVSGFVQIEGTNINGRQKAELRPKATTCDLCVEYDEPNCVRACPHGAAMRVEPKTFFAQDLAGLQLAVATELPMGPAEAPLGAETQKADETMVMTNVADLLPMLPRMRVRTGDRPGRVLQLRYPATTFGRGAEADYRFAEDTQMSRVHCVISADGERYILRDNESTNGTFVNGNRVTEIELRSGDVVQFGGYELDFIQGPR